MPARLSYFFGSMPMDGDPKPTARDRSGVLFPPPLAFLAGLGAGWLLDQIVSARIPPSFRLQIGAPLFLAGCTLALLAELALIAGKTPANPYRASRSIIDTGPYRFSRNPMYVAFSLIFAGIAFSSGSISTLTMLPVVLLAIRYGVIAREEAYLERKFGSEYLAYKKRVRRWL
ncbi:MAG TPA: isoprenylcysteine carboxylmethyltransferase family protein [Thermoanaerobaculia bacterium]|nr:isoprenylcysteine carboxylmethyltransferase family protein [Thermoanaerobaculia bacterium]